MPAKKKQSKKRVSNAKKVVRASKKKKNSMNSLLFLALGCGVLVGAYLLFSTNSGSNPMMSGYPAASNEPQIMVTSTMVQLNEQNNSGEYGNASIMEVNGKTVVKVSVKNAPRGVAQPAHIHVGSCIDLGAVKYPLKNVVNGESETTLDVSMADLQKQGPLALNVHQSTSQANKYVSCGNVTF